VLTLESCAHVIVDRRTLNVERIFEEDGGFAAGPSAFDGGGESPSFPRFI
jgi:hypothetical protein